MTHVLSVSSKLKIVSNQGTSSFKSKDNMTHIAA